MSVPRRNNEGPSMSSDTIDEVKLTEDTEKSDDTVADEADDADDKADVADEADDANDDADEADVAADDKPRRNRLPKVQLRPARPWRWVAVIIPAAAVAAGVFEYLKYRSTADQLAALRQTEADRDAVAKLAKEYALKSLTYS